MEQATIANYLQVATMIILFIVGVINAKTNTTIKEIKEDLKLKVDTKSCDQYHESHTTIHTMEKEANQKVESGLNFQLSGYGRRLNNVENKLGGSKC